MDLQITGFFGLLFFAVAIYAIYRIVQSNASTTAKVIWIVVILVVPLLGLIAWFIFGPKG